MDSCSRVALHRQPYASHPNHSNVFYMTLSQRQQIFTFNIHLLIDYAYKQGFKLTFGEVYRTLEQQRIYFNTGRSKTMNSRHLQRLAVDFNVFLNGRLLNSPAEIRPLGEFWISLDKDNVWGGDWDRDHSVADETFLDPYHFEMKPEPAL